MEKLKRFSEVFIAGHPLDIFSLLIGLLVMSVLAGIVYYVDRQWKNKKISYFILLLKRWPDLEDLEIMELIRAVQRIRLSDLRVAGASPVVVKNYQLFFDKYADAIARPFIYNPVKVLRNLQYLTPGKDIFTTIGDEECHAIIRARQRDLVIIDCPGMRMSTGVKVFLIMLGKGKNIQFRGKVADENLNQVRLYAYRNLDRRHYARIDIMSCVLVLNEIQLKLEVLNFSAKYFLCRTMEKIEEREYTAILQFALLEKEINGFAVRPIATRKNDVTVFMVSRITTKLNDELIHLVMETQQKNR